MKKAQLKVLDRSGTNSVKWDLIRDPADFKKVISISSIKSGKPFLPMWVADMDFECPETVRNTLKTRLDHGIYGYTYAPASYYDSVVNWMKRRHGWEINSEHISITPGIVPALKVAVRAFVKPEEKVVIQPPVYYPFFTAAQCNNVNLELNPLRRQGSSYYFDFMGFEQILAEGNVKAFILCNPHNPVGRVWTRNELITIGELCLKYGVMVVSDDIHSDLIYSWSKYTPFASISKEFSDITISCVSASKTFNLAGFFTSNIIITNPVLKETFDSILRASGANEINLLGYTASESAYNFGEDWLRELLEYIEGNYRFAEAFINENLPKIKVTKPEGTYLLWLDISAYNLPMKEFNESLIKASIGFDEGLCFGPHGDGFIRVNLATSRDNVREALTRLSELR